MNGSVRLLDSNSLNDVLREPFRYARDAVTHVAFSHNCEFLATAVSILITMRYLFEYRFNLSQYEAGKKYIYIILISLIN